jgi:hypothetical protein
MNRKYKKSLPFFKKWIYNKATTNRNISEENIHEKDYFNDWYYNFFIPYNIM